MEYRILGRTGLRVSAVALGCEGFIHKTPEEVCADFDFAIGHGVNFVDIYSPNPELRTNIGAALEGRRGDFVIQGHLCTTWENGQYLRTRDPEKTLASFDLQLQQLRTDCLDIGMIHYVDAEADFHRVFGGEIIRIAQRLREEGRIRHIGISSHNPAVARMAVETGLVDVLMFSVNPCYDLQPAGDDVEALWAEESYAGALRNIDPDRERLYELCERTGVGIDAMKVYGGGDLRSMHLHFCKAVRLRKLEAFFRPHGHRIGGFFGHRAGQYAELAVDRPQRAQARQSGHAVVVYGQFRTLL